MKISPTIAISCVTTSAKAMRSTKRGDNADQDDFLALFGRQARRQRTDDNRIVARQHQIDRQHLQEGGERRRLGNVGEILDDRGPHARRSAKTLCRAGGGH